MGGCSPGQIIDRVCEQKARCRKESNQPLIDLPTVKLADPGLEEVQGLRS